LTRGCLEVLAESRTPFSIITRGPLIVRDLDALTRASARARVDVSFSVPTVDEQVWARTEPGTAPPRQRLRAVRALVEAGIRAGISVAPILPGISDRPEQLAAVVRAAREAGATHLWANVVHLRPGTREHFLDHLARDWPEELERYERLFRGRDYLARADAEPILRRVAEWRDRLGLAERLAPPGPAVAPEQLELGLRGP
jgi:DNA repair photolyase